MNTATSLTSSAGGQPGTSETSGPALAVRLETDFSRAEDLREKWDEATARLGGSVYLSFDWVRTWWSFYGAGKTLRLFVFTGPDGIEAIVPLYLQDLGVWPFRYRVARLVGANVPPKVFDPAVNPAKSAEVFRQVVGHLMERDGCDLLSFGPVSSEFAAAEGLKAAVAGLGDRVAGVEAAPWGQCTVWMLPPTFEDWLSSLSKNERQQRRKYELRLLKKDYEDARIDVLSDPNEVVAEFDRFAEQHARQWGVQGKSGHFGAWPRALDYNRELVRVMGKLGRVRFIRIIAGGKVISNQYTFAFGRSYCWELPSREVDEQWDRFSLGRTGIASMLQAAIQEGKTRLEGGLGQYDYKVRLAASEFDATVYRVKSNRASSKRAGAVCGLIRKLLQVTYHKLWYRRVMPKLPAGMRRPQAMLWLKFDF